MEINTFIELLKPLNINFFTGVPDSLLKHFNNYLFSNYGISDKHIIAANEGNAVAIAAGYHLSTNEIPCVYLQNSGLGNIVNPVTSLTNENVYSIPIVYVIGWRGEPGVKDEPQHIEQGKITPDILKNLNIETTILDENTSEESIKETVVNFKKDLQNGKSVAFLVKKGTFKGQENIDFSNKYTSSREEIIDEIVKFTKDDIIVSTTGKTSRELFEIRERNNQTHKYDFLTVGSMGHTSSIALGIAMNKKDKKIWCLDGDGSLLMHMGSMTLIGNTAPHNFIHILINNEAHESVGGQPTVASTTDFIQIAKGCGYTYTAQAMNVNEFKTILYEIRDKSGPIFIEVKSKIGSRKDLGRPTTTPIENKQNFMNYLLESE